MLAHFPTPYPDETLYSLVARYKKLDGITINALKREVKVLGVNPNIYREIKHFIESLPSTHSLRKEDVIESRTIFNILTFGQPENRKAELLLEMNKEDGDSKAKTNISRRSSTRWLKQCPKCFEEQKEAYGEPFWERSHQVPTVSACYKHHLKLVRFQAEHNALLLPKETDKLEPAKEWEVTHAENCHAILNGFLIEPKKLSEYLWHHMLNRGLAKRLAKGFRVYVPSIIKQIEEQFDLEVQEEFGIKIEDNLGNLIRKSVEAKRHSFQGTLLVMCMTGIKISDFDKPLGEVLNKFPCRNSLAPCYLADTIDGVRQLNTHRWAFKCPDCSFEYTLQASKVERNTRKEQPKIRVIETGAIWEEEFIKLWPNKTLSNQGLARKANIPHSRLILEGQRLGLPARTKSRVQEPLERNSAIRETKTQEARGSWLKGLKTDTHLGATAFFQKHAVAGRWLRRHDLEWIQRHKVPALTVFDRGGVGEALKILIRLDAAIPKPKGFEPRRSLSWLISHTTTEEIATVQRYRAHSRVRNFIRIETENQDAYWLRRVNAAKDYFIKLGVKPSMVEFAAKAGVDRNNKSSDLKAIYSDLLTQFC